MFPADVAGVARILTRTSERSGIDRDNAHIQPPTSKAIGWCDNKLLGSWELEVGSCPRNGVVAASIDRRKVNVQVP
jgi:hypothetical protein